MGYEIFLKIADIIIRVKSKKKPERDKKNYYRYKNFIFNKNPKNIDIDLTVQTRPHYIKLNPEILFEIKRKTSSKRKKLLLGKGTVKAQREKEKYLGRGVDWRLSKFNHKILLEGEGISRDFQVFLNEDLKKADAFIISPNNKWKVPDIIFGFLQVLCIYYMAKHRLGIVVHSTGIKDGKNGYLFAGTSCVGKSTTCRIWSEFAKSKVLNDDRIIVRKKDSQFYIYNTPWHGDFFDYSKEPASRVKLSKLFFIYHRKRNKAEKINQQESFNLFFLSVFSPFWDKDCLEFILEFLFDIISNIPCYKFGFKNDEKIIDYIRNLEIKE